MFSKLKAMKKLISIFVLYMAFMASAQEATGNVFKDSEAQRNSESRVSVETNRTGNPGDPVPVDNFIPLLFLVGMGIIVFKTYKTKHQN